MERRKSDNQLLFLCCGGALLFTMISIFGPTRHVVEQHHSVSVSHIPHNNENKHRLPDKIVRVEELKHEAMFQSKMMKSCLPRESKKCREYIIEGTNVHRIALIAPPGVLSSTLFREIELIAHRHNHQKHKKFEMKVFQSTHVPPYGYGKTHGLTKIIRVVPRPLVLQVTDALQALLLPHEQPSDVTVHDVKEALRQILGFHCRLSHVSAHTALLSIPFLDLVSNPNAVTQQLESFLINTNSTTSEEETSSDEDNADDDSMSLFDSEEAYGARMLSFLQEQTPVNILSILDDVLVHEFQSTKNMSAWPCPSFWAHEVEPLSNRTRRLARELSPDCQDPLAKCFVARDKCEAAGQATCNK